MPTPKLGYRLKCGTAIPGTTTIIGRWKESGGLLQWAFQQGKAGKSRLYEDAEVACDIGTCAHGMVELCVSGATEDAIIDYTTTTLPDEAQRQQAWSAFRAYQSWAANFHVRIVASEIQLVSERFRYGGTPDAIGVIGNQLALIDYKTSNSVYADYLIQLAAYKHLWEENFPDQPITGGCHLLRFSKLNGDFAHHFFPNLDEAWRQFVLFREAYDIDKILKKRAA